MIGSTLLCALGLKMNKAASSYYTSRF